MPESAMTTQPSTLLTAHLPLLRQHCQQGQILDLACGQGRNGLFLSQQGFDLCFLDRNAESLATVKTALSATGQTADIIHADLEQPPGYSLVDESYSAIIVFRYLHRALFDDIKRALKPGGILIYETFTREQAALGRPKNPDFLLEQDELSSVFNEFEQISYFEGEVGNPPSAIAQLVARKPF